MSSLLGGRATGTPAIALAHEPGPVTVYVSLPSAGRTATRAATRSRSVGGGYHGILVSDSTRIPGLVSIADVAPTAVALGRGARPRIRAWADRNAPRTLARLDERLRRAHDTRTAATIVLVATTLVLAGLGVILRSRALGRAGLLAIPSALAVAFALSAAGVSRPGLAIAALAIGTVVLAVVGGVRGAALLPLLVVFLVGFLVALVAWPDLNALSVIGPHPDGGGRYYGVTNEVETLLLAPILATAAIVPGLLLVPLAAVCLALVGWSRAGADGGGLVVVLVALVALWGLRGQARLTPARVVVALAGIAGLVLAIVGVDALTGGSSHVTHAVGSGPGTLFADLGHRLRVSWKGVNATVQARITVGTMLLTLIGVGLYRPRFAVIDALLIALVASLLVNDSPTDVIAYGALVAGALEAWAIGEARATRRRSGGVVFLPASPGPLRR